MHPWCPPAWSNSKLTNGMAGCYWRALDLSRCLTSTGPLSVFSWSPTLRSLPHPVFSTSEDRPFFSFFIHFSFFLFLFLFLSFFSFFVAFLPPQLFFKVVVDHQSASREVKTMWSSGTFRRKPTIISTSSFYHSREWMKKGIYIFILRKWNMIHISNRITSLLQVTEHGNHRIKPKRNTRTWG